MIVRQMQAREFDATVNLFHYYRDEAIEAIPKIAEEYDENSAMNTIKHYASHWDHSWFLALDNQRPVGFIAGYASECPWNSEVIYANIAFVYLLESHRNLDNWRELMRAFEAWAKLIKASKITGGDIGVDPERMQKLYEHFDFKPALLMVKEIE